MLAMIVPVHCPECDATVNAERSSSSNVVNCPDYGDEASGARVEARRIVEAGSVGIIFTSADVTLETRVQRLRMGHPPEVDTLCAVLAFSAGKRSYAVSQLRAIHSPITRTLLQHVGN